MDSKSYRTQLKEKYKSLFTEVSALLYKHDPVGIGLGDNPDEYDLETCEILCQLEKCRSEKELEQIIHSVFVNMFDARTAGSVSNYHAISHGIWVLWKKRSK